MKWDGSWCKAIVQPSQSNHALQSFTLGQGTEKKGTQLLSVCLAFTLDTPAAPSTMTMSPQSHPPWRLALITLLMLLVPAVSAAGGAEGGGKPPRALLPAAPNATDGTPPAVSTLPAAAASTTATTPIPMPTTTPPTCTPITAEPDSVSLDDQSLTGNERLHLLHTAPIQSGVAERERCITYVLLAHCLACVRVCQCCAVRAMHRRVPCPWVI